MDYDYYFAPMGDIIGFLSFQLATDNTGSFNVKHLSNMMFSKEELEILRDIINDILGDDYSPGTYHTRPIEARELFEVATYTISDPPLNYCSIACNKFMNGYTLNFDTDMDENCLEDGLCHLRDLICHVLSVTQYYDRDPGIAVYRAPSLERFRVGDSVDMHLDYLESPPAINLHDDENGNDIFITVGVDRLVRYLRTADTDDIFTGDEEEEFRTELGELIRRIEVPRLTALYQPGCVEFTCGHTNEEVHTEVSNAAIDKLESYKQYITPMRLVDLFAADGKRASTTLIFND